MQLRIKHAVERVTGGMMIVPLAVGATITTFAPHAGSFFGSYTNALFTGALPILAVFYVCIGAKITLRSLPQGVRKGGVLLATKFALGLAAGFVLGRLLGVEPIASGGLAGLSALAVVAAVNDTNGGLYMSLMEQYGSAEDSAAYSVMALESGPFLTMVALGVVGLAAFPWETLVGAILPLAVGVAVVVVYGVCLIAVDQLIGGDGTAGMAASTTAGNAAAVPLLVATANPAYAHAAAPATGGSE